MLETSYFLIALGLVIMIAYKAFTIGVAVGAHLQTKELTRFYRSLEESGLRIVSIHDKQETNNPLQQDEDTNK
jgi:hypothetical protein